MQRLTQLLHSFSSTLWVFCITQATIMLQWNLTKKPPMGPSKGFLNCKVVLFVRLQNVCKSEIWNWNKYEWVAIIAKFTHSCAVLLVALFAPGIGAIATWAWILGVLDSLWRPGVQHDRLGKLSADPYWLAHLYRQETCRSEQVSVKLQSHLLV